MSGGLDGGRGGSLRSICRFCRPSRLCRVLAALTLLAAPTAAQEGADTPLRLMLQANQLERDGRLVEAAEVYRRILVQEPARMTALLSLERVFRSLKQMDSLAPIVDAAVKAAPADENVRELAFRVEAELDGSGGAARSAAVWIAAVPESAEPYRVWSFWLARQGDLEAAKAVIAQGGARVGETRLAPYAAQLFIASGDWVEGVRQWQVAVQMNERLGATAALSLRQAPLSQRQGILRALLGNELGAGPVSRRLAADVLVSWGRPEEGWTLLDGALPEDPSMAVSALRRFSDRAVELASPAGHRSRGYALERLAQYLSGRERVRARLEAAQAFADAGELGAAQRLLERLPDAPVPRNVEDAAAMAALIRVLAEAGRIEEAEVNFEEWRERLSAGDRRSLRERLAWARLLRAEFERAERILGPDSGLGAEAIRGWIALYRGRLGQAKQHFRTAGPAAPSRDEATRRTRMLVLLERLTVNDEPELGDALLRLVRGDTVDAIERLHDVAARLAVGGGRADLLAFAGEVAVQAALHERAEPLLLQALELDAEGPAAPGAFLALAKAYQGLGRRDEAVARLEEMILAHPESALVPQARRLLDQVKGMIPQS
jgi:tetratricopeptide (TPR) repeat protein